MMNRGLVSIIMLSHNKGEYVIQTCRWKGEDGTVVDRIQISKSIQQRGFGNALNSGLKAVKYSFLYYA